MGIIAEDCRDSEALTARLSPIDESQKDSIISKQANKSSVLSSLAERVRQLRQSRKQLSRHDDYVNINESDFTKTLKLLESAESYIPEPKVQRTPEKVLGFVPFSIICANDKDFSEKSTGIIVKVDKINDFQGFCAESQGDSQLHASKFQYYLDKIMLAEGRVNSPDKFRGFSRAEQEGSICRVQKFEHMYNNIFNNSQQSTMEQITLKPLIIKVHSGFETANGEDIFLDIDRIIKSRSFLSNIDYDFLTWHCVDTLLNNNSNARSKIKQPNSSSETKSDGDFEKSKVYESAVYLTQPITNRKHEIVSTNLDEVAFSEKSTDEEFDFPAAGPELNINIKTPKVFESIIKTNGISKEALQRATDIFSDENLFADNHNYQNGFVESTVSQIVPNELTTLISSGFKRSPQVIDVNIPDVALQGANINVPEKFQLPNDQFHTARSKLKKWIPGISKPLTPLTVGFTTGHGTNVKISEEALQRANKLFLEENNILEIPQFNNDIEFALSKPDCSNSTTPVNIGFTTGRGVNVKITEKALQQANKIFLEANEGSKDQQFNDIESALSKPSCSKAITPINIGFTTGHGRSVKISDVALERAKKIFTEENDLLVTTPENPLVGFQNGHDANKKIKNCQVNPYPEIIESGKIKCDPKLPNQQSSSSTKDDISKKRKHVMDDDTPAGRKKVRIGPDLQRRNLFSEIEEEEEQIAESTLFQDQQMSTTDRSIPDGGFQPIQSINEVGHDTQNVITKEVRDSIAAFLMDGEDFEDNTSTKSPNNDNYLNESKQIRNSWSASTSILPSNPNYPDVTSKRSRSLPENSEAIATKSLDIKCPSKAPSPILPDSIPEDVCFDSPFSQELTGLNVIELTREKRSAAILEQARIIQSKKSHREKPTTGSLLRLKQTNSRISLRDFFGESSRAIKMPEELSSQAIDPAVRLINPSTAASYQFNCLKFYGEVFIMNHSDGIPLEDNAILIPNDEILAGLPEFNRAFLAIPGVDPSLLPNGWIENHYKWIIWKLASMDRLKTDKKPFLRFLTPDRVMAQLKYRYDREIDRSQRPPLRRILEKDDAPSRRLILCVSQILEVTNEVRGNFKTSQRTLELTDGWYSVFAVTDHAMFDHINSKKVTVGTKLLICGAEILNLDEGRYPLDIQGDVRLKIHTNSTRRARWDAKLGYQRQSGPIKSSLGSINPNGGLVGKFSVVVARAYPILYREKTGDGQFIDRNARCEEKAAIAYERECQSRIDAVYSRAHEGLDSSSSDLENRVRNNLPPTRDVKPIAKIKVADGENTALITLWCGAEESQTIFKENSLITIRNAFASGKRSNELQITAGRFTNFIKSTSDTVITCPKRIFTSLEDVSMPGFNPHYSEFDTIGIVVSIGPAPHGMKNFETVNLAFINDNESDNSSSFYLAILFWQGVASYGFTEITTVGSFVACSNLEWRKNTYRSIPTAFCTERTVLTRNPRQNHLRQVFEELCKRIGDTGTYVETCAAAIHAEITKKSKTTPSSRDNTPNKSFRECQTPKSGISLVNLNSTPQNKRKMAIQGRLDKLKNYGPAPNLSPLHLGQTSRVGLEYKSPITRDKATLPQFK